MQGERKTLTQLSVPICLETLFYMLSGMVDTLMLSSVSDQAGSQFFIMHKDAPHLDGQYAAFGKVVAGMEVVDKIASVRTDWNDKPTTPVKMKTVELIEG